MQSKEDLAVKYADTLNRLRRMERSRDHWRYAAELHLWKSKHRGRQIHSERQRVRSSWWQRFFGLRPQLRYA